MSGKQDDSVPPAAPVPLSNKNAAQLLRERILQGMTRTGEASRPSTCTCQLPCAGCTHSGSVCHACTVMCLQAPDLVRLAECQCCHIAGAKRSAPEFENGDGGDAPKKQRLQNGAAGMSEGEALDAGMRSGSVERSRAMALGAVAEAEAAVKVG